MSEIRKQYLINSSIEHVYQSWISNETIVPPAIKMDITPVVGGQYILISNFGMGELTMTGTFKEIIPNKKLVYTWEWNNDGNETLVTVLFSEANETTRLDISHSGFTDPQSLAMHDMGWDSYIDGFKKLL